uniref:Uncharacterized protein n=1 Tax=Knipowitschia caucasica TaxID=637954 RepID=A0AAV2LBF5_KNICA
MTAPTRTPHDNIVMLLLSRASVSFDLRVSLQSSACALLRGSELTLVLRSANATRGASATDSCLTKHNPSTRGKYGTKTV